MFENPFVEEDKKEVEEEPKPREISITLTEKESTEKSNLLRKKEIEDEFGGISNIPVNHPEYWRL